MRQGVPDNRFNVCEELTFSRTFRKNSTEKNKQDLNSQLNEGGGGVRVCGIAVFLVRCCGNFLFQSTVLRFSESMRCAVSLNFMSR